MSFSYIEFFATDDGTPESSFLRDLLKILQL